MTYRGTYIFEHTQWFNEMRFQNIKNLTFWVHKIIVPIELQTHMTNEFLDISQTSSE